MVTRLPPMPQGDLWRETVAQAEAWIVDLGVETQRTDAIQAFTKQETVFVRLTTSSGLVGLGYSYTIGTGGRALLSLLQTDLLGILAGMPIDRPELSWKAIYDSTRATTPGALSSLAFAAIDTALWDLRSQVAGVPLWKLLGGSRDQVDVYDTEGGWLHLDTGDLVANARAARAAGMRGVKIKVGKARLEEDVERVAAVRAEIGDDMDLLLDANQSLTLSEAVRRSRAFEPYLPYWLEEPLAAEDVSGHASLAVASPIPIAVGESLYTVRSFREYLQARAAAIVQPDVARVGGITPWVKVAHAAEAHDVRVAPHFLMELHLPLVCAVAGGVYLEHIPQLRTLLRTPTAVESGVAKPSDRPGLGIDWNLDALEDHRARSPFALAQDR